MSLCSLTDTQPRCTASTVVQSIFIISEHHEHHARAQPTCALLGLLSSWQPFPFSPSCGSFVSVTQRERLGLREREREGQRVCECGSVWSRVRLLDGAKVTGSIGTGGGWQPHVYSRFRWRRQLVVPHHGHPCTAHIPRHLAPRVYRLLYLQVQSAF